MFDVGAERAPSEIEEAILDSPRADGRPVLEGDGREAVVKPHPDRNTEDLLDGDAVLGAYEAPGRSHDSLHGANRLPLEASPCGATCMALLLLRPGR
eukprot:432801-Lingulodinium_polyedra.AAC.1